MSNPRFQRGAIPTPPAVLGAAKLFSPRLVAAEVPEQFAVVPRQLSVWGNDRYGDCVTAEEAYAKACYSMMAGLPQLFISEAEVIAWARRHGWLNGASLTGVMSDMAKDGLDGPDSVDYKDGPYRRVSLSDESLMRAALAEGPVKLGIAANGLPGSAGDYQGWFSTSTSLHRSEDHSVALSGYGRADYLYEQLKVALPSGLKASEPGYLLFTWGTIGFVTHGWLGGSCQEAWLRTPTTVGQTPVPPVPPGPPPAVPINGKIFGEQLPDGRIAIRGTLETQGRPYIVEPDGSGAYRVVPKPVL